MNKAFKHGFLYGLKHPIKNFRDLFFGEKNGWKAYCEEFSVNIDCWGADRHGKDCKEMFKYNGLYWCEPCKVKYHGRD